MIIQFLHALADIERKWTSFFLEHCTLMRLQRKMATGLLHSTLWVTATSFPRVFFLQFSSAHYYVLPAFHHLSRKDEDPVLQSGEDPQMLLCSTDNQSSATVLSGGSNLAVVNAPIRSFYTLKHWAWQKRTPSQETYLTLALTFEFMI